MHLRFNDLIATVLAARADSAGMRATLWRQCVDLIAQYDRADAAPALENDLIALSDMVECLRPDVEEPVKLAALRELGGRLSSPRLVRLLLIETPQVQIAAMTQARLDDGDWPAIIAGTGPLARSVLRRRDDLGLLTRQSLASFGASDMALPDLHNILQIPASTQNGAQASAQGDITTGDRLIEIVQPVSPPRDQDQIRRIVDRIERFTSERQERAIREPSVAGETVVTPFPQVDTAPTGFLFTTGADGVIRTCDSAVRAMLIGLPIAKPSADYNMGPDGQILGAFRRRGAFRDGRFTIGEGPLAGCWLIDGEPIFDPRSGRFEGYRGAARRAVERDVAPLLRPSVIPAEPSAEEASLRQLIHELRTPLHGVMGFAELIESQILGPVNDRYRAMADDIVTDVRVLVDILEDLDLANRSDERIAPPQGAGTDAVALLRDAVGRLDPAQSSILLVNDDSVPPVAVASIIAERMIAHLVRALAACLGVGEGLLAHCLCERKTVRIAFRRPSALAGLTDVQLFDAGFDQDNGSAMQPSLGVGFGLRLVRRLAVANLGTLTVSTDEIVLTLPILAQSTGEQEVVS
jgi:signal transduction histidine kinase